MRDCLFSGDERAELAAISSRIESAQREQRRLHGAAREALAKVDPAAYERLRATTARLDALFARKHEIEGAEAARFLNRTGEPRVDCDFTVNVPPTEDKR